MKNYEIVKNNLNNNTTLCVVSKKHSNDKILHYYNLGERIFAENRAQELVEKAEALPKDIQWHFIGHLQRNKVKDIVPYVACIQSLDSLRLAKEINKQCKKIDKVMPCLVEFHLAKEDTNKTGLDEKLAFELIDQCLSLDHIQIVGMMVMGPHTENEDEIHEVFEHAHVLYKQLQDTYGKDTFRILSMGMSQDYQIALEHGSNMVRIGTYLFKDLD